MRFKGGEEEAFFLSPATIQVIGNAELLGLEIGQVFRESERASESKYY